MRKSDRKQMNEACSASLLNISAGGMQLPAHLYASVNIATMLVAPDLENFSTAPALLRSSQN